MKWWEKTVEYKFIKEYVDIDSFIAPLDGNEERAGDAIFVENGNFILIEFKKDEKSIADEEKKFDDFLSAKGFLYQNDNHHILVYGKIDNQNLVLNSRTYLSGTTINLSKEFPNGKTLEYFKRYLDEFLKFKKFVKSESSSENSSESYGLVAGITQNGRITKCLTLEDFSIEMELNINIEKQNNIEQSTSPFCSPGR